MRRIALLVAVASILGVAANASPAAAAGTFSCRASVLRVQTSLGTFEPITANAQDTPCVSNSASPLPQPVVLGPLSLNALFAQTINIGTAQHITSKAGVLALVLAIPGLNVTADVLTSQVTGVCVGSHPTVNPGQSQVVGLTVNGTSVADTSQPQTISLGPLGNVFLNRSVVTPTSSTQRALEIALTGIADIVVAESQVDFQGNPCA
jgi:hypothetical protein